MEIIELIVVALGCFLDMGAFGSTFGTGYAGYKARKNYLRNKDVYQQQQETPLTEPAGQSNYALVAFLLLLPVSMVLTALAIRRWLY